MKQEKDQDEIELEGLQRKLKRTIFEMVKNYSVEMEAVKPAFMYTLLLIEALQILWFSIHPHLTFLRRVIGLAQIRTVLSFLNFEHSVRTNNSSLSAFVILAFTVTLIYILTLGLSYRLRPDPSFIREKQKVQFLLQKIATYQFVLFNTIFTIPFLNVSVITLYCNQGSAYHQQGLTCYQGSHIALCFLTGVILIVLLLNALVFWFFFYTRNPFSNSFYAVPNNLFRLGKLALKWAPPIYFVVDYEGSFENLYVFILFAMQAVYVGFFRFFSPHNFKELHFFVEFGLELFVVWFSLSNIIFYYLSVEQDDGMGFIESCLCALLFTYAGICVEKFENEHFFHSNMIGKLKKQDVERFVGMQVSRVCTYPSDSNRSSLIYIKTICTNFETCNLKINGLLGKDSLSPEEFTALSQQFLLTSLTDILEEHESCFLKLIQSHVLFEVGSKVLALHSLSYIQQQKISLYEEYMVFEFNSMKRILRENEWEDANSEVNTYLKYIELMNEMQRQIELCAISNREYWEELNEDDPSIDKVYSLAFNCSKSNTNISDLYHQIEAIYPDNKASIFLYQKYLMEVGTRQSESNSIQEKLNILKLNQEPTNEMGMDEKVRFRPNEEMTVICISTCNGTLGQVLSCNNLIKKFLGYDKKELIGNKINKIMPKVFHELHDDFVKNYLTHAREIKIPSRKIVYPMHKDHTIVDTILTVKVFPNPSGFQLVGFMKAKSRSSSPTFLLNCDNFKVEGMNKEFLQMTDNLILIDKTLTDQLKLTQIFPDIDPAELISNTRVHTPIRLTDCTDKLIQLDDHEERRSGRDIVLQITNSNTYGGQLIATVIIEEPTVSLPMIDEIDEPDHKTEKSDPKIKTNKSEQVKTNMLLRIKSMKAKSRKEFDESESDPPIERKINEFISNFSKLKEVKMLNIFLFVLAIFVVVTSFVYNFNEMGKARDELSIIETLPVTMQICTLEGEVLIHNRNMFQQQASPADRLLIIDEYSRVVETLERSIVRLFKEASTRHGTRLVINEPTFLPITYFQSPNTTEVQNIPYINAVLQSVLFARDCYLEVGASNGSLPDPLSDSLLSGKVFLEQNYKVLFPEVGKKTSEAYRGLYEKMLEGILSNMMAYCVVKNIFLLIFIGVFLYFISQFEQFNTTTISLYSLILKIDACEMERKCRNFLINTFDKQIYLSETQRMKNSRKTTIKGPPLAKKHSDSANEPLEESRVSLADPEGDERLRYVGLQQKKVSLCVPGVLIVSLGVILVVSWLIFLQEWNFIQQVNSQKQSFFNLGYFGKHIIFAYYYGSKIIEGTPGYSQIYNTEIRAYREMSGQIYHLVDEATLHHIYVNLEMLDSLVGERVGNVTQQEMSGFLSRIEAAILQSKDELMGKEVHLLNQLHTDIKLHSYNNSIITIVTELSFLAICFVLIRNIMIRSLEYRLNCSVSMVKMLPGWLLLSNKPMRAIILEEEEELQLALEGGTSGVEGGASGVEGEKLRIESSGSIFDKIV